jgi:hypothetical protein
MPPLNAYPQYFTLKMEGDVYSEKVTSLPDDAVKFPKIQYLIFTFTAVKAFNLNLNV